MFTLSNANDFSVKDIVIICEHSVPSGTRIDMTSLDRNLALGACGRSELGIMQ